MKYPRDTFFGSLKYKFAIFNILIFIPVIILMVFFFIRQNIWSYDTSSLFQEKALYAARENLRQKMDSLGERASFMNYLLERQFVSRNSYFDQSNVIRHISEYYNLVENEFALMEMISGKKSEQRSIQKFHFFPESRKSRYGTPLFIIDNLENRLSHPKHRKRDDIRFFILSEKELIFKVASGQSGGQNKYRGMTVLSSPIGSGFCNSLKEIAGTDIILFTPHGISAHTFSFQIPDDFLSSRFYQLIQKIITKKQFSEIIKLDKYRYSIQYVPLHDNNNSPIGMIALAYPVDSILTSTLINQVILGLVLLIIILVIVFSLFYNFKTVIEPIHKIIDATQSIAFRNFEIKLDSSRKDELGVLAWTFNSMVESLREYDVLSKRFTQELEEKVKGKTKELQDASRIIKQDLKLAKKIQYNILPKNLGQYENINFCVEYIPMREIGGDIYDIIEIKPGYFRIFLADATGHGIQAGLITMLIKSEYEKMKTLISNPAELMELFNNEFVRNYSSLNTFFTCFILDIDLNNGRITHTSAGHPVQYLIKKDEIISLKTTGKMAAIFSDVEYNIIEHEIEPGDKIMLFSDGLFEEFNAEGEEFGEERIIHVLDKYIEKTGNKIVDTSIYDLKEFYMNQLYYFIGSTNINDDISFIGIEILEQK